jgi:hypothetical protein
MHKVGMPPMTKLTVQRVASESEAPVLLSFLQANLPDLPHQRRFEWLYRANPDGPAWSWLVCADSGNVVGAASLFPRSMWVGQKQQRCAQVGDFAISAGYRSLGPAMLLQRATFCPVDQGEVAFCYDCPPHDAGMSTFRRLGLGPSCRVDRYAIPLRVDQRLRKRLGAASKVPAAAGNLVLQLRRRQFFPLRSKEFVIEDHSGSFGEEFSHLDLSANQAGVIRGQRSAAHLNWRYRQNPLQQYHVLTARGAGELAAFAVYYASNDVVTIADLFGRERTDAAVGLLVVIMERFGKSHQSVETYLSSGNRSIKHFLRMGFRLRSSAANVVVYAAPNTEIAGFLNNESSWSFSQAEVRA